VAIFVLFKLRGLKNQLKTFSEKTYFLAIIDVQYSGLFLPFSKKITFTMQECKPLTFFLRPTS